MNLVGPFPASAVIERLRALPALRLVDGAAGLKSALEQLAMRPRIRGNAA